jgi:hypothetical protein
LLQTFHRGRSKYVLLDNLLEWLCHRFQSLQKLRVNILEQLKRKLL